MGTCGWCGDKKDLWRDTGLCETCDNDAVHCSVCGGRQHYESKCRHVFQDENFEWSGSGVGYYTDASKQAFMETLTLMPEGFARDLRVAIKSRKFHTWFVAPMIGGGALFYLYGMPDRDGRRMVSEWGDALAALGEREDADEIADGYRCLASLYDGKTRKANAIIIGWIDEWLRDQVPRVGAWFWHQPCAVGALEGNKP
jgi:hypothetical protein